MGKIAINGYGRIGRLAHRVIIEKYSNEIEVAAVNATSSTDICGWMYLLKYDSVYGELKAKISCLKDSQNEETLGTLVVEEKKIPFFAVRDPALLPWKDLGVEIVIESSGKFTSFEKAKNHLAAGAKKVIISAPAKSREIKTYILGVNWDENDSALKNEVIISNGSCTTNAVAPIAQIMVRHFGVLKAMMTTIHAYTSDQKIQDGGHKDYRRARAAAYNIVPTTTGATMAATEAVPELINLFSGLSFRVPVICGSLADFTFLLKRKTTIEEIKDVFKKTAKDPQYEKILNVTEEPLVSSDIIGSEYSAVVDLSLIQVIDGDLVKIVAWYDNEWAYANRLVEEAKRLPV